MNKIIEELCAELNTLSCGVVSPRKFQTLSQIAESRQGVCAEGAYFLANIAQRAGLDYQLLATQHKIGDIHDEGHRSLVVSADSYHYLFSHSDALRVVGNSFETEDAAVRHFYDLSARVSLPVIDHMFFDLDLEFPGWNGPAGHGGEVDLRYIDGEIGSTLLCRIDGYRSK